MGEGYAAIQRGGRAACSGGRGVGKSVAIKYVMASEPYRYTLYLKQDMTGLLYSAIYYF
jgi:hypothetical protein